MQEVSLDGLNFSPRNMQQLLNNALKEAKSATLTTINGDQLALHGPIELGTECIAFRSAEGDGAATTVVPFSAIQRLHLS
jgi:hypothetical protein